MDQNRHLKISEKIDREAEALIELCLVGGNSPSSQQLRRLSLLFQVRDQLKAHPAARRRQYRWITPVVILAIYGILSLFASRAVTSVGINLQGHFSDVILQSADRQVLDGLTFSDLRVSGFRQFQLERDDRGSIVRSPDKSEVGPIYVKGDGIRMYSVFGTRNTVYSVSTTDMPSRFLIRLSRPEPHHNHKDESLVFFEVGGMKVDVGKRTYTAGSGGRLILTTSPNDPDILRIEFGVSKDRGLQIVRDVDARSLVFSPLLRITPDGFAWLNQSSVLSGVIRFFSLKERKYELQNGECLNLENVDGRVSAIRVQDGSVNLTFSGDVKNVLASSCTRSRSIKPSILEWLVANEKMSLILAAAGTVITIVFAAVRWWNS